MKSYSDFALHGESKKIKKKKLKGFVFTEDHLQQECIKYIRLQYPNVLSFHVPNGGKRGMIEAVKLKRMGVLAGASDILVLHPKDEHHEFGDVHFNGLCIELKIKPNTQTEQQLEFEKRVTKVGYMYAVCFNFDQFKEVVDKYLGK